MIVEFYRGDRRLVRSGILGREYEEREIQVRDLTADKHFATLAGCFVFSFGRALYEAMLRAHNLRYDNPKRKRAAMFEYMARAVIPTLWVRPSKAKAKPAARPKLTAAARLEERIAQLETKDRIAKLARRVGKRLNELPIPTPLYLNCKRAPEPDVNAAEARLEEAEDYEQAYAAYLREFDRVEQCEQTRARLRGGLCVASGVRWDSPSMESLTLLNEILVEASKLRKIAKANRATRPVKKIPYGVIGSLSAQIRAEEEARLNAA